MSNTDMSLFEDPTLLLEFIAESLEHLESIESKILEYEKSPEDKDLINTIFRAIHSIKGAASFFNLTDISELSHKLETLLNDLRNDRRVPNPEILDILLSGSDLLRTLINQLSESTDNQIQSEVVNIEDIVGKLEILLSQDAKSAPESSVKSDKPAASEAVVAVPAAEKAHKTTSSETSEPGPKESPQASKSGYEITPQIMQNFKVEAIENLQLAEDAIMVLDKNREDNSQINSIFRGIHTIKGASDYLGLNTIKTFAHDLESLLDVMRKMETFKLGDSAADLLLESVDALRTMCDSPQEASSINVSTLLERIHKELADISSEDSAEEEVSENPQDAVEEDDSAVEVFASSAKQHLDSMRTCQNRAAAGETDEKTVGTYLRSAVTLKNAASYMGFEKLVKAVTDQEDILNIVKDLGFTKEFLDLLSDGMSSIEQDMDAIIAGVTKAVLPEQSEGEAPQPESKTAAAVMEADEPPKDEVLESEVPTVDEAVEPSTETAPSDESAETVTSAASEADEPDAVPPALTEANLEGKEAAEDISEIASPAPAPSTSEKPKVQSVKTMRIDEEKLDAFMSLVGELIISKNTFSHIARRLENNSFDESTLGEFQAAMFAVNRITDELQNNVMSMRMIPVKTVFQRFPRLIRDLAKKKGKLVELHIQGEDTELDKGIAEAIGDPLVHLIRNCVDHGVETPEERQKAGKDKTGHVILRAAHEGNNIIIEVTDDGKGIISEKVLKKAIEKGLVGPEEAESMSRDKIINLIFLPGFSTADKITDVSGRGVGMDVVNTNIAKLNGTVKLDSEPGEGSKVRVELPLTLAIIEALLIKAAGRDFAIPLDSVLETIQVTPDDITMMQKREVVLLRGESIGITRLRNIMVLSDNDNDDDDDLDSMKIPIVIISAGTRKVGIVVDKLMNQEEIVIKPLHDVLAGISGLGGASIMGDGHIVLILDPLELINISENEAAAVQVT